MIAGLIFAQVTPAYAGSVPQITLVMGLRTRGIVDVDGSLSDWPDTHPRAAGRGVLAAGAPAGVAAVALVAVGGKAEADDNVEFVEAP